MDEEEIKHRIANFKNDLTLYDEDEIIRRHISFGECAVISSSQYHDLRSDIAAKYSLHPNDVLVVGSGKLGFSIAPKKRYRHFGENSDLDVVIISESFFDGFWQNLHEHFIQDGRWKHMDKFCNYLFRGWIRPDMLPKDESFNFGKEWWEFFNELTASRKYPVPKIRGAVYRNWHFLEAYQRVAIAKCTEAVVLEAGNEDED